MDGVLFCECTVIWGRWRGGLAAMILKLVEEIAG